MPMCMEGHEPGDLAPSMGWLLGKKRSVLLFLALLLRAEPKAKSAGHKAEPWLCLQSQVVLVTPGPQSFDALSFCL